MVCRTVVGRGRAGPVRPATHLGQAQELPEERVRFILVLASLPPLPEFDIRAVHQNVGSSDIEFGQHQVVESGAWAFVQAAVWACRSARGRTHGKVINAQAAAPTTSSESRYHGHGPNTSSRDLTTGLELRKP